MRQRGKIWYSRRARDDDKTKRMRCVCCVAKSTKTQYRLYLLRSRCNCVYENVAQY